MDNFCSNFAFQQDDDQLGLHNIIPTLPCEQQNIQKDFINNYSYASLDLWDGEFLANINNSTGGNNLTINENAKRQPKSSAFRDDGENSKQKVFNSSAKDIERQRRQEMANLCASLRMQLPLEYLKGNRSVSDLIHVGANYIKYKEKNLEELKAKRDSLKNLTAANDLNSIDQSSSSSCLPINLTVGSHLSGVEILISVDLRRVSFSLSRVLELVLAEGLNVVSCVCTKANGKILHIIQIEDNNLGGVDIHELQQKLTDVVNTP